MNQIMYELPLIDLYMLDNFAISNDPMNRFSGIIMKTSPASLEADKLLSELKSIYNKALLSVTDKPYVNKQMAVS